MIIRHELTIEDVDGRIVVTSNGHVSLVNAKNESDIDLEPFLLDGYPVSTDLPYLQELPLIILEPEEAAALFHPILEKAIHSGILTKPS